MTGRQVLGPVLLALLLSGCGGGASCEDLPRLTAERDEARAAFAQVTKRVEAGSAGQDQLDAAHDVMHGLDKRVHDLAGACD